VALTFAASCCFALYGALSLMANTPEEVLCNEPGGGILCDAAFMYAIVVVMLESNGGYANFASHRLDRLVVDTELSPTPRAEFRIGFYAKAPETAILIVKSSVLWGEITWLDDDHLKIALVVDERATWSKPVPRVGPIRIEYQIYRDREPALWPRGLIGHTPVGALRNRDIYLQKLGAMERSAFVKPS
jgi:hypothetical protein